MLKNLKWYESMMLIGAGLISIWTLIDISIGLKDMIDIPFRHLSFCWWQSNDIGIWGAGCLGNFYIQIAISLLIEISFLFGIFLYIKNKTLTWPILFIGSIHNIYFFIHIILKRLSIWWNIPEFYSQETLFNPFFILLISIFLVSVFSITILSIDYSRNKFKIQQKGFLISLFIAATIIFIHYGFSY